MVRYFIVVVGFLLYLQRVLTGLNIGAFAGCSGLTKVNYTGAIDQWMEINFADWFSNPLVYAKNLYINNELVTEVNYAMTRISSQAF